jgi:hypothetical protein
VLYEELLFKHLTSHVLAYGSGLANRSVNDLCGTTPVNWSVIADIYLFLKVKSF